MKTNEDQNACREYQTLNRRQLLVGGATLLSTGPLWMPKVAFAKDGNPVRDRLIVVNLRGGSDGLSFCAPVGDPVYYSSRPGLTVPPVGGGQGTIDIDGYFAFPRTFSSFSEAFNNKHLSVLHAVGRQNWSFSHFEAAKWMEQGETGLGGNGGWLARHLATSDEMKLDAEIRALNLAGGLPTVLTQGQKVLTSNYPDELAIGGNWPEVDTEAIKQTYLRQYMRLRDETRSAVRDGVRATLRIQQVNVAQYNSASSVVYDGSTFGRVMKSVAALMKADIGIEIFHTEIGGWDTHIEQGTNDGLLASKMEDLSRGITSLYRDLMADGITNWTLVVISEFGRRINENGGEGCEHGEGNTMMVLSPNLKSTAGGKVLTDWPGIEVENRTQHDGLKPTTDDRDVWAEIVEKRLGNPNIGFIFPGYTPQKTNLLFEGGDSGGQSQAPQQQDHRDWIRKANQGLGRDGGGSSQTGMVPEKKAA